MRLLQVGGQGGHVDAAARFRPFFMRRALVMAKSEARKGYWVLGPLRPQVLDLLPFLALGSALSLE